MENSVVPLPRPVYEQTGGPIKPGQDVILDYGLDIDTAKVLRAWGYDHVEIMMDHTGEIRQVTSYELVPFYKDEHDWQYRRETDVYVCSVCPASTFDPNAYAEKCLGIK